MGLAVLPVPRGCKSHVLGSVTCGLSGPVHSVWPEVVPSVACGS
jgi:hypothetical protein